MIENTSEDNMKKYQHYRYMLNNLKYSLEKNFYLQAVLIEYAIIEDRIESIIKHLFGENKIYNNVAKQDKKMLEAKLNYLKDNILYCSDAWIKKYVTFELINKIKNWKKNRNAIVHSLMNRYEESNQIKDIALEGEKLTMEVINTATKVKKRLEVIRKNRRTK